jgi:DNA-binding response OmpR family regulator
MLRTRFFLTQFPDWHVIERSFVAFPATQHAGTVTVLLVDDEEELRTMCCRGLEADGFRVIEAADGVIALGIIQERTEPVDLVITDLKMPRLSGLELAELLSVFQPELPVLAITGDPGMADRRLPTLLKPFSIDELTEAARLMKSRTLAVRRWAEERRAQARKARELAMEMQNQNGAVRKKADLVAIALELQRLSYQERRQVS